MFCYVRDTNYCLKFKLSQHIGILNIINHKNIYLK